MTFGALPKTGFDEKRIENARKAQLLWAVVSSRIEKKRILIADNSVTVQKLVHLTFAELDYEIITASDGADAFTKSRTFHPSYVLADCRLEQLDGMTLCENIRKEKKLAATKVILLKSSADKDLENRIRDVRPDAVLLKPFDSKSLKKVIEDLKSSEESTVTLHKDRLETTVTNVVDSTKREDESTRTATIVLTTPMDDISKKHNVETEEPTPIVQTKTSPISLNPSKHSESFSFDESKTTAEKLIQQWVDKNMPAIAERIIKEEILRQTQGG